MRRFAALLVAMLLGVCPSDALSRVANAAAPDVRKRDAGDTVAEPRPVERARYLMGTTCRIVTAHDSTPRAVEAIESAFAEISRWEAILSDYDPESELSRLNASAADHPFRCSRELFGFLSASADLSKKTTGAFDITVGPLVDLYALRSGGRWPSRQEIDSTLRLVGSRRLRLDAVRSTAAFLSPGMRLDPGAIGKGYALDAAVQVLESGGVKWALVDFGGQIVVVGSGPGGCGLPVAISGGPSRAPAGPAIYLSNASASTSGNDERGLIVAGRELSHIIDPATGVPAEGTRSVTVVAPTAALADALSTALFVLGPTRGLAAAAEFGVEAAYQTSAHDGAPQLRTTPGFARIERQECAAGSPAPTAPRP